MNSQGSSPSYDADRAARVHDIFCKILCHTKGRWARKPFVPTDWQRDEILNPMFGVVRYDEQLDEWVRQYRTVWLELARGNGKSELLAGIGLVLLVGDDEEGAEVYGAARDREQASLVFGVARRMVELSPALSRRLVVIDSRKTIVDPKTDSSYRVIAADAAGNLGQNPHGILFDEIIAQPSRELWDALRTGMGKRSQPLMVAATTAGNNPNSFAAEEHDYCTRVADDPTLDPTRLVFMRNTPADADPWDERGWYHANPALGEFLSLQTLRDEATQARQKPTEENSFRQYRLNQWVTSTVRWLSSPTWDAPGNSGLVVEDQLRGKPCFGGLDLASTEDFTAWVLIFPHDDDDGFDVLPRFWLPRAALERRTSMRSTLEVWERQGFLQVTEGDVVDYAAIRRSIDADAARFVVQEFAYDRWNATQLVLELQDGGLLAWPMAQTTASMSLPSKELERLLGLGVLNHGGNPILRWMAGNAVVRIDGDSNIKPDKRKSGEKIDGIVALVMALAAGIRRREDTTSVYEEKDMLVL